MECSVCGQPGASKCLAVDEFNNPIGNWVHTHCIPGTDIGRETQSFRGVTTYRLPRKAQSTVRRMWGKPGYLGFRLGGGVRKL